MKLLTHWGLVTLAAGLISASAADNSAKLTVQSFGAVGDGVTKDTRAIQQAIDTCAQLGGGTVKFTPGKYLTGSLQLKSHVTLNVPAGVVLQGSDDTNDYPLATARWEGMEKPAYLALIRADQAKDIGLTGGGTIQGGLKIGLLRNPRGPTLIEPIECTNVQVSGLTLRGNRMWTVHPTYCQDVTLSNLTLQTTGGNSDGIDPDSCRHVLIDHCSFEDGDDNIAIKSGKGQEGVRIGRPSEDITIQNCTFIKGYSSIAFGSELSGGIRNVTIRHCIFQKGRAALYLKSRPGRAGYIDNVNVEDVTTGPEPLLEIDINYKSNPDIQGVAGPAGLTKFSHVKIVNARVQGDSAVKVVATPENPADGIDLEQITGACAKPWIFKNANNIVLKDIHLAGLTGQFLSLDHATGAGLDQDNH
jgi:polygalacturonase